jgi:hypothetical protein
MVDTEKFLAEVRQEIARLQRIETALVESSMGKSKTPAQKGSARISDAGRNVISLAAKLRHARRSGDRTRIKNLTQQLATAKKVAEAGKGR